MKKPLTEGKVKHTEKGLSDNTIKPVLPPPAPLPKENRVDYGTRVLQEMLDMLNDPIKSKVFFKKFDAEQKKKRQKKITLWKQCDFVKIIEHMFELCNNDIHSIGMVDRDDFYYNYKKFKVKKSDIKKYESLFDYLEEICFKNNFYYQQVDAMFPEWIAYLKYKKIKFLFRVISGQGTCWQIIPNPEEWDENKSVKIDKYLKSKEKYITMEDQYGL